jgi:hypothetical protein
MKDADFETLSRSDLCSMIRELRAVVDRERQRATALQRALDLQRQQSQAAWRLAAGKGL